MKNHGVFYEIQLDGKTISLQEPVWQRIRDNVRYFNWFYLMYNGKKYKYVKDRTFCYRSAIFIFESIDESHVDEIDYINIDNAVLSNIIDEE